MATPAIKTAAKDDIERIIESILLAFSTDPVVRWLYPATNQYFKHFPNFVRTIGDRALKEKTIYYTEGYSGAAFWYSPQSKPDDNALAALLQQTISQQQQEEVFAVFEQSDDYHPHEPHWYLAILGVETTQQKKGYGSRLIEHILKKCDRNNTIAYLESSNLKNIPFYERHGFEVIGKIQAGKSPTIFPMLRRPS